jgi:hypothetical protein
MGVEVMRQRCVSLVWRVSGNRAKCGANGRGPPLRRADRYETQAPRWAISHFTAHG